MTDVNLSATVDSAIATVADKIVGTKKARKPSVTGAAYIAALKAGSAAEPKKTAQQVADELGMEKTSFDQRLNQYRKDWKQYGFVVSVKQGKTAADLGLTQEAFDAELADAKANKNYDGFEATDTLYQGAFPWSLADGRSNRDGESTRGSTARSAILAALSDVG
jgi:hypothetical protein